MNPFEILLKYQVNGSSENFIRIIHYFHLEFQRSYYKSIRKVQSNKFVGISKKFSALILQFYTNYAGIISGLINILLEFQKLYWQILDKFLISFIETSTKLDMKFRKFLDEPFEILLKSQSNRYNENLLRIIHYFLLELQQNFVKLSDKFSRKNSWEFQKNFLH